MSKVWVYTMLTDAVDLFKRDENYRYLDLIESCPFGLVERLFGSCSTIHELEERIEEILDEIDAFYISSHSAYAAETDNDDDSDWFIEEDDSDEEFPI